MFLKIDSVGRKYGKQWLFRNISKELCLGDVWVLIGRNGSGKSTLLKMIAGYLRPTEGSISWYHNQKQIDRVDLYKKISWYGPEIGHYSVLTLKEAYEMHFKFKNPTLPNYNEFLSILDLKTHSHKLLSQLSSGLLQRFKVGLTLFSDSPLLLIDEPTGNLDEINAKLVSELIENQRKDKILIFASNLEREFENYSDRLILS